MIEASKAIYDSVKDSLTGEVKALEGELGLRLGKMLENRLDKALGQEIDRRIKALEEAHEDRITFLQKHIEESIQRVERLIGALSVPAPIIQVTVPEIIIPPAVVNVLPAEQRIPDVMVHVAEREQLAPVVNFTLPDLQLPAPIVNVAAAETKDMPAPVVNVSIPRRKMVKHITYDERSGRPITIEETEEEVTDAG
jgi:hypothetical protein